MDYLLIFFFVVLSGFSTVLQKNFSISTAGIKSSLGIFMLIAHPLAAVYFYILSGFSVNLNTATLLFSTFYALSFVAATYINMISFSRISLIYISVFNGAGSVIIPFLYEMVFGNQSFSIYQLFSVTMRIMAVLTPFVFKKKSAEDLNNFLICILIFLFAGITSIIPKEFAIHPKALDNNSFCFWANVVSIPIITAIVFKTNSVKALFSDTKKLRLRDYGCIFACTAFNNLSSILRIEVLKTISATIYSVLSSSLSMLFTASISIIIYKEKLSGQMVISIIFSILSVLSGMLK